MPRSPDLRPYNKYLGYLGLKGSSAGAIFINRGLMSLSLRVQRLVATPRIAPLPRLLAPIGLTLAIGLRQHHHRPAKRTLCAPISTYPSALKLPTECNQRNKRDDQSNNPVYLPYRHQRSERKQPENIQGHNT